MFKKLNKLLEHVLNELALLDTPCWGKADSIIDAYNKLVIKKSGSYIVPNKVKIEKIIDNEDVTNGYSKEIQKGVFGVIEYPLKICYGEVDTFKQGEQKRGHGISHGEQGHNSFKEALNNLSNILKRNIAKYDKRKSNVNGNYIINLSKYSYTFAIKNGYAILVTAYKN